MGESNRTIPSSPSAIASWSTAVGSWPTALTSWPLTISLLLHVAVFVSLLPSRAPVTLPEGRYLKGGAEVVEFGVLSSAPEVVRVARRPVAETDPTIPGPRAEEAVPVTVSQQIGHAEGESGTGDLGVADGVAASARERYLYELTVLLNARKIYPMASRRMGETGRIVVRFIVLRDGTVEKPEIKAASLSERLNRAALDLIAGIGRFKPWPTEMNGMQSASLAVEVPIEYVLN